MKRILVTGGAGFLGSHLCTRLLAGDCRVLCVDNFLTGSRSNVEQLLGNPLFELIEHDISNPLDVQVDEIFNLACPASPPHYQKWPIETAKASALGVFNMLELARSNRAKILQASTSEVYGDPEIHPQKETYWGHVNPTGIRSCYDEGKRYAESLCFDFHRQYRLTIKVARIFNTYGPRMDPKDGRVVSNFIVQALKNEPLTLYGDGRQTRSFCYVSDMIDGLIVLMRSPDELIGPVNLGNPHEVSVSELAGQIIKLTGSSSRFTYLPLPSDDPTRRCPDISLAKARLGWEPMVSLDQGLHETIAYLEARKNVV